MALQGLRSGRSGGNGHYRTSCRLPITGLELSGVDYVDRALGIGDDLQLFYMARKRVVCWRFVLFKRFGLIFSRLQREHSGDTPLLKEAVPP